MSRTDRHEKYDGMLFSEWKHRTKLDTFEALRRGEKHMNDLRDLANLLPYAQYQEELKEIADEADAILLAITRCVEDVKDFARGLPIKSHGYRNSKSAEGLHRVAKNVASSVKEDLEKYHYLPYETYMYISSRHD